MKAALITLLLLGLPCLPLLLSPRFWHAVALWRYLHRPWRVAWHLAGRRFP